MVERLKAIGYNQGFAWDDGSDHEGISKIYVRGGLIGIQTIQCEYVKTGQLKHGDLFGVWNDGFTQTFEIDHFNNEHLESVEGYYNNDPYTIQAVQFKTNFKVSELIGYKKGIKFSLSVKGKMIIGFYGCKYYPQNVPSSLGAYVTFIPPSRLEAKGGESGDKWDDGADHEGITKIHLRGGYEGIQYIKFDYIKSGQPKVGSIHGLSGRGFPHTFEIDHLNGEHLVSVEGYYDDESGVIQALQFRTNIKASELLGYEKGKKFSLAHKGKKIIGFHGYADNVTFDYDNGHIIVKRQHGWPLDRRSLEEEFELDYPNEFITSVDGTFKAVDSTFKGSTTPRMSITSLVFRTSKGRTSKTFGSVSGTKFVLESKGCALVGFHGWIHRNFLGAIGAYFSPLPPPSTVEKLEAQGCNNQGASWMMVFTMVLERYMLDKGDMESRSSSLCMTRTTRWLLEMIMETKHHLKSKR
ncbi:unnamed protein product [Microthlaspi erraticum]|uniref:Jacalin-type lectin domain-containing protein n=1 Tax=Microthlaspi erraticum TaxID=1685480 RepID=A0A6D2IW49_9BRAS|nr:unnamed protein product [Microthlaspi erraticum]